MSIVSPRHREYAKGGNRPESPYFRAKREWDARLGTARVQAHSWRVHAMALAGLLGASMLANVYLGRQPKLVPHVIEVDALGEARYRGPVGDSSAEYHPPEPVVRFQLRRWVELTRTVSTDTALLRKNWTDAYSLFTEPARARMDELGEGKKAFTRAQTETTSVEIVSAVPLTTDSWQIDWRETTRDLHGQQLGKPQLWRVLIKVLYAPPKTRAQMAQNPLGLYVDEFHWDRMGAS